ncbi:hypothetical protein J3R83DRAFT_1379 [Lanmaoa asiatica]|nr:hypothetical protein J3R83DRAFT_1379 [Lanmaoa asiatica]
MSDDGRPANTTAQPPFDDVDADIILHTSDHVDFRLFQRILALSSSFFQGMFALPQHSNPSACANSGRGLNGNAHKPADEMANPPSVDVPEGSQTLATLLRFLYPNTHVH